MPVTFPGGMALESTACPSIRSACAAISSGVSNVTPCGALAIRVGLSEWQETQRRSTILSTSAKEAGREPDPTPGVEAKVRSVHNNYLTLPVVLAMISNHFPWTYGHEHGWLVLLAFMAIGAWIRHFFNLRHRGRNEWWILATAAVALAVLAYAIRP